MCKIDEFQKRRKTYKLMYSFGASLCRKKMAKAKMKRKDSFVDCVFDEKLDTTSTRG